MLRALGKFRDFLTRDSGLTGDAAVLLALSAFHYVGHIVYQARTAPSELGAFGALLFLWWAIARGLVRPSFHILYLPLILYGTASSISSIFAENHVHEVGELTLWFKILLFPVAVILFRLLPRVRDYALWAHAFLATMIAGIGIWQFFVHDRRDLEHRITGTSTHVMTYSGLLLPLSLFFAVLAVHYRRWWMIVAAATSTFALLLTFTRSAWLGWIIAVLVVIIASRPRWLVIAAPLLVFFVTFMPLEMFGRMVSTFDTRQSSNLDRIRMLQAGVEIIRDYPLLGVGPANIKQVYPIYRKHDAPRFRIPHLHNNIVQIWAERGIVAIAGYLLLLVLFLRECARGWRGPARPWAEAGLAFLVGLTYAGLFEFNFGDTEVFYLMLDLMALTAIQIEARLFPPP